MLDGQNLKSSRNVNKSSVTHLVVKKCQKYRVSHKNDLVNNWQFNTGGQFL